MLQQIRDYFERIAKISDRDWDILACRLKKRHFGKKELILQKGDTENYISFVQGGIIRYYIPKDSNDITFSFIFPNSFMSAYDSFITRSPCIYEVSAITDTILWSLTYEDMQEIYRESGVGNMMGRHTVEALYIAKVRRELSLLTQSAEERYLQLLAEWPELIINVPLKYIASYIGITPQALSRIRKNIS